MFQIPMNYELFKSLQEENQKANERPQGASNTSTLPKAVIVVGGLFIVGATIIAHLAV
jgi:hypothetical protein